MCGYRCTLPASGAQHEPDTSIKPLPVLIVEDDPALREALQDTLRLAGYQVIAATDGEAALALLERTGLE